MRIAICDDTPREREEYAAMIRDCLSRTQTVATLDEYSDAKQLMFELDDLRRMPDILYIDIKMPDIDGVTAVGMLNRAGFDGQVIFLTNSSSHWRAAFDLRAFNYFVKGDPRERFEQIFDSVLEETRLRNEECIILTNCGEAVNIPIRDIGYFESYRNILTVHYGKEKTFDFYSTIGKIEEQLFDRHFLRIHKSYLVSAQHIAKLTFEAVLLQNGEKLPVGRTYYREVKQQLETYMSKPRTAGISV